MNITRALDHYRIALLRDKDAYRVLSIIYLQGPIAETSLPKKSILMHYSLPIKRRNSLRAD